MKSIWDAKFIVVDVETTGSKAAIDRIIDIAAVAVQDGEIVEEYSTLVKPHRFIPPFISKMTRISNEMVFVAPEEIDVAPKIAKIFDSDRAVFVAHNAQFDWSFVTAMFKRLDMEFREPSRLCTLKLSRKLLNGRLKKNVGNLANYFHIELINRHRALGDARATAEILVELLEIAESEHDISSLSELLKFQNQKLKNLRIPKTIFKQLEKRLREIPAEPGVYYFFDKRGALLYVGKAKKLSERARSYFTQSAVTSRKIAELVKRIARIEFETTGTELAALLLESKEIKRLKPPFNSALKKLRKYPLIKLTAGEKFPRVETCNEISEDGAEYYGPFRNGFIAKEIVESIEKRFRLRKCHKPLDGESRGKPCFYYSIDRCGSPCSNRLSENDYREELEAVRNFLSGDSKNVVNDYAEEMNRLADNFEFEQAAALRNQIVELKKIFDRKQRVPSSINENNLIIVLPASHREKTVEVFLVKRGKLVYQELVGRRASLKRLLSKARHYYFNGESLDMRFTLEDVDELKIISSWIFRKSNEGEFIYINNVTEKELAKELENAVRNANFENQADESSKIELMP